MPTLLETQVQSVLNDGRSSAHNMLRSDRTFAEILRDPKTGDENKRDVVDAFVRTFKGDLAPDTEGQVLEGTGDAQPFSGAPPEAPALGPLQAGEYYEPGGTLAYDPELEATQSIPLTVNLGSLAGGKKVDGKFLPGPPRGDTKSVTFNLPPGMRPDEIPEDYWDKIIQFVRTEPDLSKEFAAAQELEGLVKTGAKAATREAILGIPALLDLPNLAARGADYVLSPTGTNTLFNDTFGNLARFIDYEPLTDVVERIVDPRGEAESVYLEDAPRIGMSLGLYTTEYPNALFEPMVVVDPNYELAPVHRATGKLLDSVLTNIGLDKALTPQEITEAQKITGLIAGVMGGSLSQSSAIKAGATLVSKGMTFEDLQKAGALNKALYNIANTPGVAFMQGGQRRFTIPGTMVFGAKDLGVAGVAGTAMALTPDEWGPKGKLLAGLGAPLTLSATKNFVTNVTRGQGLPIIGGMLEPFSQEGQIRLANRYLEATPGVRGNEALIVRLLENAENFPTRPGQSALLTTPAYFDSVSNSLMKAEQEWTALSGRGVPDDQIIAQLSQNPEFGRYFNEIPIFPETPTLETLSQARVATKSISDGLLGTMSWLASGSPIKNEVLRSASERFDKAEEVFKNQASRFAGDPEKAAGFVEDSLVALDDLVTTALSDHAADAALYNRLVELVEDPVLLAEARIGAAERAIEGVQNAYKEARQIERAVWRNAGGDTISIDPSDMALIGDKAADIILSTPAAQRNQVPPILFQLAGRTRLLSDNALAAMAKGSGAADDVPRQIVTARAKVAQLQAEYDSLPSLAADRVGERLAERLERQLEGAKSRLKSLEDQLLPSRTTTDEAIETSQVGILDSVDTLDEVFAARGALVDAAARSRARTGGANAARLAGDMQTYIIDDWLQNPELFAASGTMSDDVLAAYNLARKFSQQLNDRFTRGSVADFLSTTSRREDKADPNQFLAKLINDDTMRPGKLPSGSVDELDAALVKARAPFLMREDNVWRVDPDAPLTPNIENLTWQQISSGEVPLSSELLREELLNRLALVAVDRRTGDVNTKSVNKFVDSLAVPINKVEESFPGFRSELLELSENAEKLAVRKKALVNPTKKSLDKALQSGDMDELAGALDGAKLVRRVQEDRTVASVFLDNDPNQVAAALLKDPQRFASDVTPILQILKNDESGAALAGFKRALWNEMSSLAMDSPGRVGRKPSEVTMDPKALQTLLRDQETTLRKVFDDVVPVGYRPDESAPTTFDMLRMYADEMVNTMAEIEGRVSGVKAADPSPPLRAREFIRNLGRIAGVKLASLTGGPALVMAGTGGRVANELWKSGGQEAILRVVSEALTDPNFARDMLVNRATLNSKGRFVFDKRLTQKIRPHLYIQSPGVPTQVIRETIEDVDREDQIRREGGREVITRDPKENIYRRQRIGDQSSLKMPTPNPASALGQVSPVQPLPQQTAAASPETMQRGQQIFGVNDPIFAKSGGIMSVRPKPRQMVG